MYRYETHMHTSEVSACGGSTAAEQVRAYHKRGYAGVIITDHFINGYSTCPKDLPWESKMRFVYQGYEAAKEAGGRLGLDVFFGWEYAFRGWDFLTYGLGLDFLLAHPGFDKLNPEAYSKLVRANGGYLAQAHPYRVAYYIENPFPAPAEFMDGMEVFNATLDDETNKKAYDYAKKHSLALQAGSDSHNKWLRFASGIKLEKKAANINDIISALKAGRAKLITR